MEGPQTHPTAPYLALIAEVSQSPVIHEAGDSVTSSGASPPANAATALSHPQAGTWSQL